MHGGTDGTTNATNDTNGEKTEKTIDSGEKTRRNQTTSRQKIRNTNEKNAFFGDGGNHEDF
jgi:hypothetical protein